MKLVLITYNEAIDIEVMDALEACGINILLNGSVF